MVPAFGAPPSSDDRDHGAEGAVQPQAIVRTWRVTRSVARDPAGIASLIGLLAGIVLSVVPTPDDWGPGVNSVGYALVGGAFFSFIYQFWANDALIEAISARIRSYQERAYGATQEQWNSLIVQMAITLDDRIGDLISMHKRHWPAEVYPEGSIPNSDFNQRLEKDLKRAARYDFRGQSGRHLASRLFEIQTRRPHIVRVIIEDVTIPNVVNARIDEKRYGEPEHFAGMSDDELAEVIRNDLFDSLVGFYRCAHARDREVEVVFAARPTDVRMELIDGIAYLSPFIRNRPPGNKYPEVYRFDPDSIPAQMASLEFDREFAFLSETKITFTPGTSKGVLRSHLQRKGWDLSLDEFDLRYREAEISLQDLARMLGESSHDL